jgi:hypothetical protein
MDIGNLAHAVGEVASCPMVGDLDLAPGAVRVEKNEQVDRAVARILVVVAFELARCGRDRLARLADQLPRRSPPSPPRSTVVAVASRSAPRPDGNCAINWQIT